MGVLHIQACTCCSSKVIHLKSPCAFKPPLVRRVWSNLPNVHKLHRPLDTRLLKESLERIELVQCVGWGGLAGWSGSFRRFFLESGIHIKYETAYTSNLPNGICGLTNSWICWQPIAGTFPSQPSCDVLGRIHGQSTLVSVAVDASGQKTVTGNSKKLKDSAHYPLQFGLEMANLIKPHGAPSASTDSVWSILLVGNVQGRCLLGRPNSNFKL